MKFNAVWIFLLLQNLQQRRITFSFLWTLFFFAMWNAMIHLESFSFTVLSFFHFGIVSLSVHNTPFLFLFALMILSFTFCKKIPLTNPWSWNYQFSEEPISRSKLLACQNKDADHTQNAIWASTFHCSWWRTIRTVVPSKKYTRKK